jgi:hypothetical protein
MNKFGTKNKTPTRAPIVPGAKGKYPTPKPVAIIFQKSFISNQKNSQLTIGEPGILFQSCLEFKN